MVNSLHAIAILVAFGVSGNAVATDFCASETCKSDHTVCKYGFLTVNRDRCGNPESTSLTPSEIKEIVDIHNSYRAQVASGLEPRGNPGPQPSAENMSDLSWDTELADVAQTWANQCRYGHDDCRNSARFSVGQNVAIKKTTNGYTSKLTELVTMWYEEVKNFDNNQVKSVTNFNGVGHYTQMLWADTTLVGCGGVRYKDGTWFTTYLVCNYGPAGNWNRGEMYKTR